MFFLNNENNNGDQYPRWSVASLKYTLNKELLLPRRINETGIIPPPYGISKQFLYFNRRKTDKNIVYGLIIIISSVARCDGLFTVGVNKE